MDDDFRHDLERALADDEALVKALAAQLRSTGGEDLRAVFFRDEHDRTSLVELHDSGGALAATIEVHRDPMTSLIEYATITPSSELP
jgi:hypothetical protein